MSGAHAVLGEGSPVLLLHGLGGDRHQSLDLLAADERRTRIAPELPGHGSTELPDDAPVTFERFAGSVAGLLDALAAAGRVGGRVPVVGVSMGAGIALTLAATRPDLVERLVLVRPAWLAQRPAPNLAAFGVIAELLVELDPVSAEKAFASSALLAKIDIEAPAMAQSLLRQFRRPRAREFSRVLAEMPRSLPLPDREAYRTVTVDTLVLVAPHDPVHPFELGVTLAEWLPNARWATLPRKQPDPAEHQAALQRAVADHLGEKR